MTEDDKKMSDVENLLYFFLDRWNAKIMSNKDGESHMVIFPAKEGTKKIVAFSKGTVVDACIAACLTWHEHQEGMWSDEQVDQLIAHASGTEDKETCPWCKAQGTPEGKLII